VTVLQKTYNVGNGSDFFQVVVADTNEEAEYKNFVFQISGGSGGLSSETVNAAVQAFVDSLVSSSPTFVQTSITKTTIVDESL
jgi:hypothetical protein